MSIQKTVSRPTIVALLCAALLTAVAVQAFAEGGKETGSAPAAKADASALKPVALNFAAPHTPPQTYAVVDVAFIDRIKELSGGKIMLKYFPGGTLIGGADSATELAKGVADISWPRPGYSQNGYLLYNAFIIFMYNLDPAKDVKAEFEIFKKVHKDYPELMAEYEGLHPYAVNAGGTSAYLFMRKPFKSLADIKGKTIRATGSWAKVVKGLGGEPITIPISETYLALEKGTIDGTLGLPVTTLKAENLAEVVKYAMDIGLNMSPYYAVAFNKAKWDSLQPEAQALFTREAPWFEEKVVLQQQAEVAPAIEHGKKSGVSFIDLPAADRASLYDIMDRINRDALKPLDAKGLKATEIYEYTQKLIKQYKDSKK